MNHKRKKKKKKNNAPRNSSRDSINGAGESWLRPGQLAAPACTSQSNILGVGASELRRQRKLQKPKGKWSKPFWIDLGNGRWIHRPF